MAIAAGATFLMLYADSYVELLAAALGVGLAGGAFSVGVAYVSSFYPQDRQGTALGDLRGRKRRRGGDRRHRRRQSARRAVPRLVSGFDLQCVQGHRIEVENGLAPIASCL